MTKQTAIEHKKSHLKQIAIYQDYIDELDAIINSPDPDPRIGKLFWFWDGDERVKIADYFGDECLGVTYPYATQSWRVFTKCRPVTMADLEGKIYQEPRKTPKTPNKLSNLTRKKGTSG